MPYLNSEVVRVLQSCWDAMGKEMRLLHKLNDANPSGVAALHRPGPGSRATRLPRGTPGPLYYTRNDVK